MKPVQTAIWSGALANGPMTMALLIMENFSEDLEEKTLPPATLTADMAEPLGFKEKLTSSQRVNFTLVSHFAYSVGCALLFGELSKRLKFSKAPPLLTGSAFGLAVWGLGYLGWIPGLGLRNSAHHSTWQRNLQMIFAHLIWGASLAFVQEELRNKGNQLLDGEQKTAA